MILQTIAFSTQAVPLLEQYGRSTTDEQLDKTIVLELVDGMPGRITPTANLVQIQ